MNVALRNDVYGSIHEQLESLRAVVIDMRGHGAESAEAEPAMEDALRRYSALCSEIHWKLHHMGQYVDSRRRRELIQEYNQLRKLEL